MTNKKRLAILLFTLFLLALVTPVPQVAAQSCVQPPSGMVSWWRAENDANDSQDSNDGTLQNGATFAPGKVGQAFSFDGVDDLVSVPAGPATSLYLTGNQVTIDGWLNPTQNVDDKGLFGKIEQGGGDYGLYYQESVRPFINGTSIGNTGFIPPVGVWTHLALTYDANLGSQRAKFYVNGALFMTFEPSGPISATDTPLVIGGIAGRHFNGPIDEVEVYNRALTQAEIQAIYNAGSAGKCKVDHFLGYKIKPHEKFTPLNVALTDQFGTETVEVKKPVSLYNPADKNEEGINDPDTHLTGYKVEPETEHVPVTNILVKNQFHPDGLSVDTIKPSRLLVPTLKDLNNPVTLPDPFEPNLDHYKCYNVKVTPKTPKFPKGTQATVVDQFNQPKLYDIKKPTRLCTPVLDKEHPPGTHTLAKNPDTHLMCYQAKPAKGQPKHVKVLGIHVNNQFGPEQMDTIKEEELCVPSEKIIGGG